MKKKLYLPLILALSVLTVACSKTTETSSNSDLTESGNAVKVVENEVTSADEKNAVENENAKNNTENKESEAKETSYDVNLSYPATAYIVDGNEEEKEIKSSVTLKATQETIVEEVINALKEKPSAEGAEPVGLDKYKINSCKFEEGQAIIDFSSEGLEGSSTEEDVLLRSIVNSLLSVKGIKSVKFTVDGKEAESLMGQIETLEAFTDFI